MKEALGRAKKNKAAGDTQVPIEYYQALVEDKEAFELVFDVIMRSWNGENFDEWSLSKLKILPKKGDLSDPNNWRPIMLLEVIQKTMSLMFTLRFHALLEHCGLKEQFGFQRNMGTTDGSFVVRQAINLRHEAGKDTYVLFVDLVKAFDSVPRDGMIKVLGKFGVPERMLNWIERIYEKVVVKVEIENESDTFASCTGVKQGDNLSPTLFLFMMQAFMELLRNEAATGQKWPERLPFRTRKDGVLSGRPRSTGGKDSAKLRKAATNVSLSSDADCLINPDILEFDLDASLYADDAALMFSNRQDLVKATNIIYSLLKRFGLMMHVGSGDKASKTEAMFIPGYGRQHSDGDTSRYTVNGTGFIDFTTIFPYLGSKITSDCKDDADIDNRIIQASKMFGSLRNVLCSKRTSIITKKTLYEAYVLPILLYGSEMWRLNTAAVARLEKFHRKNVRAMAGVTTFITWKNRISAFELEKRFRDSSGEGPCLRGIRSYIAERALRWLGHVVRMDSSKLPRRMLSAWVYRSKNDNSKVGTRRTYGATIAQYHFEYLLKNPTINTDVREALTKEVEHRSIESGKDINPAVTKMQTFYTHSHDKPKENWVRIAENRDDWKKQVVQQTKFHYNYRYPEHIKVVAAVKKRSQVKIQEERLLREMDRRMALHTREYERRRVQEEKEREQERQQKKIRQKNRINKRNANVHMDAFQSLT